MTEELPIAQEDLQCTSCAGQCVYTPETGRLTCESCGAEHKIPVNPHVDPTIEHSFDPDVLQAEQPKLVRDRPYQCDTCGGEVVFHGHSISENCPYCHGALVERPSQERYPTLGLIPFAVTQEQAQTNAQKWVSERWAAPSDLADVVARSRVAGIYVPFWTFDSKEAVKYSIRYKVSVGKRTETRSQSGSMRTEFDDLLAPASPHVTPLIRDGILHDFYPGDLRPFEPAYLAGFAAELHHQSVQEGLKQNEPDKRLLLANRIKSQSGKSRIVDLTYLTDTTGIRYRRILLPVWILHYEYSGKHLKVVTCGLKGRTFGERPFSMVKLIGMATALAGAATVFGFLWGALQLY
ncbi:MAG: hypothetical protein AAGH74_06530 [Pseudomonadota bacterium]